MPRTRIMPHEAMPLISMISYAGRVCSDGQCCSFEESDPSLPQDYSTGISFAILKHKRYLNSYVKHSIRGGCDKLEISFSLEDRLYISSRCKRYESRDAQCRDFGIKNSCNFREYVREIKREGYYSSLFLLLLKRERFLKDYPFLEAYDLSIKFPAIKDILKSKYFGDGIYIPMPAEEKVLP